MKKIDREQLRERLLGIKALVDDSTGENSGIELLEESEAQVYALRFKTKYEQRLASQIAFMHLGSGHAGRYRGRDTHRPRNLMLVVCSEEQFQEIEADYLFYKEAMDEDMEVFYDAFLQKNQLFPPPELCDDDSKPCSFDIDRLEKIWAMMDGIDKRTRPQVNYVGDEADEAGVDEEETHG